MIIELQNATKDFGAICDELNELGNEIGVNIKLQHKIFLIKCIEFKGD